MIRPPLPPFALETATHSKFQWPVDRRPDEHAGLSDMEL